MTGPSRTALDRLRELVAWRLWPTQRATSLAAVERELRKYSPKALASDATSFRELLAKSIEDLRSLGWVEPRRLLLAPAGRAALGAELGDAWQTARCCWAIIKRRPVTARALGISPATPAEWTRLGTADGLRAAIIAQRHGLCMPAVATRASVLDALAWRRVADSPLPLGGATGPFTRDSVLRAAYFPERPPRNLAAAMAAQLVGAASTQLEPLRDALIGQWLAGATALAPRQSTTDAGATSPCSLEELRLFAKRVTELAQQAPEGRFGEHKVFIAHVWRAFSASDASHAMPLAEFTARLVAAHRARFIELSRADLISVMDPLDVAESEIRLPHGSYHFIRIDASPA